MKESVTLWLFVIVGIVIVVFVLFIVVTMSRTVRQNVLDRRLLFCSTIASAADGTATALRPFERGQTVTT